MLAEPAPSAAYDRVAAAEILASVAAGAVGATAVDRHFPGAYAVRPELIALTPAPGSHLTTVAHCGPGRLGPGVAVVAREVVLLSEVVDVFVDLFVRLLDVVTVAGDREEEPQMAADEVFEAIHEQGYTVVPPVVS